MQIISWLCFAVNFRSIHKSASGADRKTELRRISAPRFFLHRRLMFSGFMFFQKKNG